MFVESTLCLVSSSHDSSFLLDNKIFIFNVIVRRSVVNGPYGLLSFCSTSLFGWLVLSGFVFVYNLNLPFLWFCQKY